MINKILTKYSKEKENLSLVLQEIQEKVGYISKETMEEVADFFGISPADVYTLVTFYKKFRRTPPAIHPITVCMGTACYLAGSASTLVALEEELGIKSGQTSKDGLFSIETASCFGCCNFAPVVKIKDTIVPTVTCSKVEEVIVNLSAPSKAP